MLEFLIVCKVTIIDLTDGRNQTVMFETLEDWRDELERTKGNVKYKAVTTNEGYRVSEK